MEFLIIITLSENTLLKSHHNKTPCVCVMKLHKSISVIFGVVRFLHFNHLGDDNCTKTIL